MQPIIYFFGTLPGGFSSYPQDHTKAFFQEFLKRSKNVLQIVVYRKDNLLHYGYVRKFGNNYFGICICIDRIYNDVGFLFKVLDDVFADMVKKGVILKMTPKASIEWSLKNYASESAAIHEYSKQIIRKLNVSNSNTQVLPPANFSVSINDCLDLSLESGKDKITEATKCYSNLYIVKTNAEIERVTGFIHTIKDKNKEIDSLKQEISGQKKKYAALSAQLTKAKVQKRNIVWTSMLGSVVLILGFIVWNYVLFPDVVTNYKTENFNYYGPLKDGKPHGVGVAIYPENDEDGRMLYVGNFNNGIREDSTDAVLSYKSGSFFYGQVKNDSLKSGMFFYRKEGRNNTDGSQEVTRHFEGTFENNKAFEGVVYLHINGEYYKNEESVDSSSLKIKLK